MFCQRARTIALLSIAGVGFLLSADLRTPGLRAVRLSRTESAAPRTFRTASADLGDPEHACRFWGMVGTGYPEGLIEDHLRSGTVTSLRQLGLSNDDGWGLASFLAASTGPQLRGPLVRRGRPPTTHPQDPDFNIAVDEMVDLRPRAAIGHVRAATSGHFGLPDPHPFLHERFAFAHNGSLSCATVVGLLTADDPGYLDAHPPEYIDQLIDSELLFMYLLKYRRAHPEQPEPEALRDAASTLFAAVAPSKINFVMTAGDTLYALRCAVHDDLDPVRYYPGPIANSSVDEPGGKSEASPYWVVASQGLGSDMGLWLPIPARTLAVFVPGQPPQFLPLIAGPQPVFSLLWASLSDSIDADGDGYLSSFTVDCGARVDWGTHRAFVRVFAYFGAGQSAQVAVSDTFMVSSPTVDTVHVSVQVRPPDHPRDIWDLCVQLCTTVDPDVPQAELCPPVEPRLGDIQVEGPALDAVRIADPADPASGADPRVPADPGAATVAPAWIGEARPNPSGAGFVIPFRSSPATPPGSGGASLEVWDARGALVWRALRTQAGPGAGEIRWDGRDLRGQRAAAGVYFCRIRAGGQTAERRVTVMH